MTAVISMEYIDSSINVICISGIEQKDERHFYLNLAKDASLDVPAITKTVVENIRKKNNEDLQAQSRFTINTAISKVRLILFLFSLYSLTAIIFIEENGFFCLFYFKMTSSLFFYFGIGYFKITGNALII